MNQKQKDALGLLIESLHKPDAKLRGCAYNQDCYDELLEWRDKMLEMLYEYERKGTGKSLVGNGRD